MIVDLKHIFVNENTSLPIEYSLDMSAVDFSGVFPLKKPVTLSGAVFNKASLVEIDAVISYVYGAPCDRCGVFAQKEHTIRLKKPLAPKIEGDGSDTILLVPDMKLDLDELVYSEVITDIPMSICAVRTVRAYAQNAAKILTRARAAAPKKRQTRGFRRLPSF